METKREANIKVNVEMELEMVVQQWQRWRRMKIEVIVVEALVDVLVDTEMEAEKWI